jgi:hypothetical protein
MRRASALAIAVFTGALLVFAIVLAIPFLTKERDYPAAITSPPPLLEVSLDDVAPGRRLCMSRITADAQSQVARFHVGTYGKPGPPLTLDVSGPGYRATARVAGGYPDNLVQQVRLQPPASSLLVRACIRNDGRTKISLYSADDGHATSRAGVTVGGRPLIATPAFGFWEAKPHSIAARTPLTVHRIGVFRGPLGYTWVVWLVLALALVGLTAGLGLVLWQAFRVTAP